MGAYRTDNTAHDLIHSGNILPDGFQVEEADQERAIFFGLQTSKTKKAMVLPRPFLSISQNLSLTFASQSRNSFGIRPEAATRG